MRLLRRYYRIALDAFDHFLAADGWAIASHIALSTLMALFPFLIVVTSLAGFFGSKELADQGVNVIVAAAYTIGVASVLRAQFRASKQIA